MDQSLGMLELARNRLPDTVRFDQADLREPLKYADAQFSRILASLVMHYLEDWKIALDEFHRVLEPGGALVISTHHPFMDFLVSNGENYFATYEFEDHWIKNGQDIYLKFWHRPLQAMLDALRESGFVLDAVTEPLPDEAARTLFADDFKLLSTQPRFIFFRVLKPLD